MMTTEQIKQMIESGLPESEVNVQGDDGAHFDAVIISSQFVGKTTLQQHQLVYQVLGEKMGADIHALSMRTYTPDAWIKEATISDPRDN